jgi:serine/threonine-protein kinase
VNVPERADELRRIQRQLLERALTRGGVSGEVIEEADRRLTEARARGAPRDVVEVLRELGVPERALRSLDLAGLHGRVVGGFRLDRPLGLGGMGAVYEAEQASLGRRVAVKILDRDLAEHADVRERFRREARAAAKLQHRHVVQPIDFGEEGELLYFAMERMAGGSVGDLVEREGALPERRALGVARAVADALVYAAEQGIVHRDIKAHNILFDAHGEVKLADLGLALDLSPGASRLTAEAMVVGSPHYISPEQVMGDRPVDARADIYALGITLFEMLTGRLPFNGPTATAIFAKQVTEPLPALAEVAPGVRPEVRALVERMCRKEPEARHPDALALRDALDALLRGVAGEDGLASAAVREPQVAPETTPARDAAVSPAQAASRTSAPPDRARARALVAVGVVAALVVAVAGYLGGGSTPLVSPEVEAQAIDAVGEHLWAKQRADGAFGSYTFASDPWSTAEALRALALLHGPGEPRVGALAQKLPTMQVGERATYGGPGFAGYPLTVAEDTVGFTEATADAGLALALAHGRVQEDLRPAAREVLAWLVRAQSPDGSWPSLPVLGVKATMTAPTALGLHATCALLVLVGPDDVAAAGAPEAIARAVGWLCGIFEDRPEPFFDINPQRRFGADRSLPGVNERCALALLEARALQTRGLVRLPGSVDETLREYAEGFQPSPFPVDHMTAARPEDYLFVRSLQPPHRSTVTGYRWVVWTWRLLLARALARADGLPRADDWAEEAARLRAMLPEVPSTIREMDTWQVADYAFAAAVLRAADRHTEATGEAGPALLVDLVR